VLEHGERDEGGVRGRQAAKRISYLRNDSKFFDLFQGDVLCTSRDIGARKRGDERSISTKAARQISRQIRRRYEEPGQHGTLDYPNRFPASPELKERSSRNIFRVVYVRGHSESVAIHTIAMLVEDSDEGIAVIAENGRPGGRLVPIGSHH
jgi:hypothetical protein